ncbi:MULTISPECIES: metallophosphoesterase [unclassified Nocardia]|uniref:metallophosphoesterase n=1 Tax=unclassified Nocardia TaxID=2637762 RepID=UPI001CE3C8DF|nr:MULTISPECIES: metallophosphoesterase [unclassified Nocardia]
MSTSDRTVTPADGSGYRELTTGPGEAHVPRTELAAAPERGTAATLLRFVHLTDFQLADPISPGRLDFLQRLAGRPGWDGMFPAYRPQELVAPQAFEAMIRTIRETAAADTAFVITTGDNTDNAQYNELLAYLTLLDGDAEFDPLFGAAEPKTHPSHTVSGDFYNPEPESRDRYKREHGFPDAPGALAAAALPFPTRGLGIPWLACFGNHDCLAQGRAPVTPEFQRLVTGNRRPIDIAGELPDDPMARYLADPTALSGGPALPIEARADRRLVSPAEYIRAHLDSPALPPGHGFTPDNLADVTAYYCYDDIPGIRVIVLDTTNSAGGVTGSIGARQRDWLIDRLTEVHSAHLDPDGATVRTGNPDRVVILASHHGIAMLDNATPGHETRYLAADIEAILHRFGNVVLWLAGHEHRNSAVPRPGPTGGYWHVITSGLCEWPCQARTLELLLPAESDRLVIRSTMIDHAAPAHPEPDWDLWQLASLHRELAYNEPTRVGGPHSAGTPADRNADLVVPIGPALAAELATLAE